MAEAEGSSGAGPEAAGAGTRTRAAERFDTLRVEHDSAGVAWVELHRPARKNAIDPAMARELTTLLAELEGDESVRVLVLRGADGNFCSGGDLAPPPSKPGKESGSEPARPPRSQAAVTYDLMDRIYGTVVLALHRFRKPVLAAVEGVAAGAGANLAFGCDVVYAAEGARFCQIFVRRGLTLDCGGSWLLPRLVGLHKAKELALFGEWIDADEAQRIGVVARVFPTADFEAGVRERAHALAAQPPIALALTKQALGRAHSVTMAEALELEAAAQATCTSTHDFAEGMAAFLEKRPPRFEGR